MRILAIERDSTACNYYRIIMPLTNMDEQGLCELQVINESRLGEPQASDMAMWADLIVFQRPATEAWFNFIKVCRKAGKLIVSDYDDDPFNTSPLNPYYQYIGTEPVMWQWPDGTKEWLWSEDMVTASGKKIFSIERNINHRDMFKLNFKKSDLVTCTTEELRQDFLKINPNVSVLPNLIDPDFFPHVAMEKKEVRIGWQGGASHYEDLYFLKDIIKDVLDKHSNAKFIYFGDLRFEGMFKHCNKEQLEFHSWVPHAAYPYKLATLNLDIGLCPLVDNEFNRKKSAIKWMEYSMMGMATIASNIPPYNCVIDQFKTGFLVDENIKDWVDAINELVNDKSLSAGIAAQAKEDVLANHNIETKAHLWKEAYEHILRPVQV